MLSRTLRLPTFFVGALLATAVVALGMLACSKSHTEPTQSHILTAPAHLAIYSGDGQQAVYMGSLPEPMVVLLTDSANYPIPNKQILFRVVRGNGQVLKPVSGANINELITSTENNGKASAQFQYFGGSDGGGPHVTATVVAYPTLVVEFQLTLPPAN